MSFLEPSLATHGIRLKKKPVRDTIVQHEITQNEGDSKWLNR